MDHTKHKLIKILSPSSAGRSYGRVISLPLAAHVQVLASHLGYHYRFGLENQGSCSSDLYIQHPSALDKGRTNLFPQHFSFQLMKQNQLALQKINVFTTNTVLWHITLTKTVTSSTGIHTMLWATHLASPCKLWPALHRAPDLSSPAAACNLHITFPKMHRKVINSALHTHCLSLQSPLSHHNRWESAPEFDVFLLSFISPAASEELHSYKKLQFNIHPRWFQTTTPSVSYPIGFNRLLILNVKVQLKNR